MSGLEVYPSWWRPPKNTQGCRGVASIEQKLSMFGIYYIVVKRVVFVLTLSTHLSGASLAPWYKTAH